MSTAEVSKPTSALKDKQDLLYTREGQELLKQLQEACPNAPPYFQEHGVRLALAGLLPDVAKLKRDKNKPLTGAEKRKQAKKIVESVQHIDPKPWTQEDMRKLDTQLIFKERTACTLSDAQESDAGAGTSPATAAICDIAEQGLGEAPGHDN